MPIDFAKMKDRLNKLTKSNSKSIHLWKPKPGKQIVRIVPYKFNAESPFIELLFHYGFGNPKKTYLSPATFGKPDPIVEFSDKLKTAGDKESWKQGKTLEPKMRTYALVLVRGEEELGVRFWGFGKTTYETLMGIMTDEDYGDISDLKTGRDITVDFTEGDNKEKFPETNILVKPNVSAATTDKAIVEKIKTQIDILTLFPESTYEELDAALTVWLDPEKAQTTVDAGAVDTTTESPASDDTTNPETSADEPEATKSVDKKKSAKKEQLTAEEAAEQFDDIFNEVKK